MPDLSQTSSGHQSHMPGADHSNLHTRFLCGADCAKFLFSTGPATRVNPEPHGIVQFLTLEGCRIPLSP
jgi:hypothetical protein